MRYCPECTIKTELITYEVNGVRGERCIPCKKMWILETTFARGLGDLDTVLKEVGKSKFQCPDCRGLFFRYEVQRHQNFIIDKCSQCDSVWMPVGAVKAFMELEPMGDAIQEEISYEKNLDPLVIAQRVLLAAPVVEEDKNDVSRVIEKKNINLSFVLFIIMALVLKVSPDQYGFTNLAPFRMGGLTIITCAFLHSGLYHFVGNMLFYLPFAYKVEARIGSEPFFTLFIVSSLFSVLAEVLLNKNPFLLIGASGAIMGVLMYYSLAFPKTKVVERKFVFFYNVWRTSRKSVYFFMLCLIASDFFNLADTKAHVAYAGHLGGALGGFIYYLLGQRPEFKKD